MEKAANELAETATRLRGLVDQFEIGEDRSDMRGAPISNRPRTMAAHA